MSSVFYMASDAPLKERPNPNCKTLSVNEALAMGMDVPEFLLEREPPPFHVKSLVTATHTPPKTVNAVDGAKPFCCDSVI